MEPKNDTIAPFFNLGNRFIAKDAPRHTNGALVGAVFNKFARRLGRRMGLGTHPAKQRMTTAHQTVAAARKEFPNMHAFRAAVSKAGRAG